MMNVLEISGLSMSFGSRKVLENLNLSVPEHAIYGFLGENGAGKSTTMKLILGLLRPDSGQIRVFGETVHYGSAKTNRRIGFLPDVPEFYGYLRPEEYLVLCGKISGMNMQDAKNMSRELLEMVGLEKEKKKIRGFSRGMKQRLGIAQALMGDPGLLICDEPTSALDPVGRREILEILDRIRERTTVLFSTHILSDVERICDRTAVLHKGHIVLEGEIRKLKEQHQRDGVRLVFSEKEQAERFLALACGYGLKARREQTGDNAVLCGFSEEVSGRQSLLKLLIDQALFPEKMEQLEPTLESMFLEVVQ